MFPVSPSFEFAAILALGFAASTVCFTLGFRFHKLAFVPLFGLLVFVAYIAFAWNESGTKEPGYYGLGQITKIGFALGVVVSAALWAGLIRLAAYALRADIARWPAGTWTLTLLVAVAPPVIGSGYQFRAQTVPQSVCSTQRLDVVIAGHQIRLQPELEAALLRLHPQEGKSHRYYERYSTAAKHKEALRALCAAAKGGPVPVLRIDIAPVTRSKSMRHICADPDAATRGYCGTLPADWADFDDLDFADRRIAPSQGLLNWLDNDSSETLLSGGDAQNGHACHGADGPGGSVSCFVWREPVQGLSVIVRTSGEPGGTKAGHVARAHDLIDWAVGAFLVGR